MTLENYKNALPDHAKDIRLNLSTVLTEDGAPDLSLKQIYHIALASAYASRTPDLITAMTELSIAALNNEEINATKSAAIIMAMNNVYYRFTHSMQDKSYAAMPAKLRMNVMMNPGMDKITFELCSFAVSAINGCGLCMNSHATVLEKAGTSKLGIQSAARIAAVINAAAVAREI